MYYFIQHCPICNPSDSTVSTVGGCWAVLRIRIHMLLGLLDPDQDPLVRGMDPDPDPALDPDPSIIMQK
jgi:hypothetical protein